MDLGAWCHPGVTGALPLRALARVKEKLVLCQLGIYGSLLFVLINSVTLVV